MRRRLRLPRRLGAGGWGGPRAGRGWLVVGGGSSRLLGGRNRGKAAAVLPDKGAVLDPLHDIALADRVAVQDVGDFGGTGHDNDIGVRSRVRHRLTSVLVQVLVCVTVRLRRGRHDRSGEQRDRVLHIGSEICSRDGEEGTVCWTSEATISIWATVYVLAIDQRGGGGAPLLLLLCRRSGGCVYESYRQWDRLPSRVGYGAL